MAQTLRVRSFVVTAVGFMSLYLILAESLSPSEIGTGVVLAVAVSAWAAAVRRAQTARFAFSLAHVRIWTRQCARVPAATLRTGLVLARVAIVGGGRAGRAAERLFHFGPIEDPIQRARRATAVLAASLSPESYVVRGDPSRSNVLVHRFGRSPTDADDEWLT